MAAAVEFSTIPEMFRKITEKYGHTNRSVLMHKVDGAYRGITYHELRERVELLACGLASLCRSTQP
jgi:long-subunit acyl-CoA synthetase (AMP-forming)